MFFRGSVTDVEFKCGEKILSFIFIKEFALIANVLHRHHTESHKYNSISN
jgi:hypothetical protein